MDEDPHDEWPIFAVWEDYLAHTEPSEDLIIVFNKVPNMLEIVPVYVIR